MGRFRIMSDKSVITVSFSGFGVAAEGEKNRLIYCIDLGFKSYDVFFSSPNIELVPNVEAALPLALLAGMRLSRSIHVSGVVSAEYIAGVRQVVSLFADSFDGLSQVKITADEYTACARSEDGKRMGCFFSGGVDSFYSLLSMKEQITDLVVVHGFDFPVEDKLRSSDVSSNVHQVAKSFGKRVLEVNCNPHQVIEDFGEWAKHGFGFALMAIGRTLSGQLDSIVVPGSFSLAQQRPWGSWIESDHLFSDQKLRVIHHADKSERIDKTMFIVHDPMVKKCLRVCWKNVAGKYNCGICEKCVRTMTALEIAGVRKEFETFPGEWSPRMVAAIEHDLPGLKVFAQESLECMKSQGSKDVWLRLALLVQIYRPIAYVKLKRKLKRRAKKTSRSIFKRLKF